MSTPVTGQLIKGAEMEENPIDICNKIIQAIEQGATTISAARALTIARQLKHDHEKLKKFRSMVLDWAEELTASSEARGGGYKTRSMLGDDK